HRRRAVLEQPPLERGIHPGARDDAGTVAGTHLRLVGVDQLVERGGVDQTLVDQQRLQCPHAQLDGGQRRAVLAMLLDVVVIVVVVMMMLVLVVVTHDVSSRGLRLYLRPAPQRPGARYFFSASGVRARPWPGRSGIRNAPFSHFGSSTNRSAGAQFM